MPEPTHDSGPVDVHRQATANAAVYARLHETAEFEELRRRYRNFAFPATIAFLVWYLLYVVMSNWASGFMKAQVVGNINVALVFGLLQFVTTFGIAFFYARYMHRNVDPLARQLEEQYNSEVPR